MGFTFEKVKKQIEGKPVKLKRFLRFSTPRDRKFGRGSRVCRNCGRHDGVIQKYKLLYCRQCFREFAERLGWTKYH
ncbi:MAG: 30S ribosomal protein S14 [Candidatus Aenigmarchaeota archaeon]|nr:30S ribosomal protein S14 [Candidatus Aenigmarchaeota archaeon]